MSKIKVRAGSVGLKVSSLCVCLCPISSSYKDTSHEIRAHPHDLMLA